MVVLDIKKEGYIDEKDFCRRCTELLVRKGYGPSRIRSELYKKGFTQRMIDYTMEKDQTDFLELLRSQMRKKSGKVSAVYWPVVTALYLAVSFLSGRWDATWVVWPVAAVLFGAVSAFVER